jgi:hypothetical protein
MSSEKSVVIHPPPPRKACPICGKATYSAGGIHPQCAIEQADAPRLVKMRAARVAEPKTKEPARRSWKKRCPKCSRELHVRREACECGHAFGRA